MLPRVPRFIQVSHVAVFILQFALVACAQAQASDGSPLIVREEAALRAAAERVAESVVQIRTIGGLDTVGRTLLADGPTTGLIISADGYIVSSAFNFVQQPASILVTFANGKQSPAELVATDHSRMLVLLKATGASDLSVPELVPAVDIRAGQWAVAVGRTFRSDRTNVSVGIVSATDRMFGKVLQTDADVSMANYGGPLVDIRGRVLGVIVPMAPQATSEVAGVEWYDSGIGFAVPIASISERLEKMKRGEDQHAGMLGIGLIPGNPHVKAAELAAVRPDAPAAKAGLKKGDRIVEIDGKPIRTQADLRFALGPRYGSDRVKLKVERGSERLSREIELIGELPEFRHAFLGILPMRPINPETNDRSNSENPNGNDGADDKASDKKEEQSADEDSNSSNAEDEKPSDDSRGVAVRMVYAGSPAEQAGLRARDRIIKINDAEIGTIAEAIAELNNATPGSEVALHLMREGKPMDLKLTASRLPTSVPAELPAAYAPRETNTGDQPSDAAKPEPPANGKGETSELKLPEFPQQCRIYLPAMHDDGRALGLLLWLHAPGKANAEDVIRDWQAICDRDGLILVIPASAEKDRWDRTELEYLARLVERAISQHKVDPNRVVVYGEAGGGTMAWL
ncbi:MAG TPA: PDZ domain-containing protein, partial [Lacipirellulaceae bacterium]|nr:PDZ domain-containing protein [Lacipirellulaceae bacterium]